MKHALERLLLPALGLFLLTAGSRADVLLIPDSGNDKVWAFDPFDGTVLSDNFIPADGNLVQPINAVDSGAGTVLVSDENADAVFEYSYAGTFVRTVAGGLDALQGMTVEDGIIYVSSRTGPLIYRITLDGTSVTTWSSDAALGTPRDLVFRDQDVLITNSGGDNIERFDSAGQFLDTFHDSDGLSGIDFPQQIQLIGTQILAAGFTAPFGLYLYDASGNELSAFTNLITSPRGVYALGNGRYLYSGGTRVMTYDPVTMTEETIVNQTGTSFRYIEFSPAPAPVGDADGDGIPDDTDNCIEVANVDQRDTNGDGLGNNCDADMNNDCMVNFADLSLFKAVFFSADADADFNGDDSVNFADLSIMKDSFFGVPGPSASPNDCE